MHMKLYFSIPIPKDSHSVTLFLFRCLLDTIQRCLFTCIYIVLRATLILTRKNVPFCEKGVSSTFTFKSVKWSPGEKGIQFGYP